MSDLCLKLSMCIKFANIMIIKVLTNHYFPMQSFFNAHLEICKHLIYSILQDFTEGQKFVRGTDWGLHFCKETNKICKNALFLEILAYLHFVAWLNGL